MTTKTNTNKRITRIEKKIAAAQEERKKLKDEISRTKVLLQTHKKLLDSIKNEEFMNVH